MAGISTMGIGSGIDIRSLVDGLVNAERKPAETRLNSEAALVQARVSALGSVKAALSRFQASVSSLGDFSAFRAMSASVSDQAVLSASASANAVPGSYDIEVYSLARAQSLASGAYADITSTVGTGRLTFRFGTVTTDPDSGEVTGFSQNPDRPTRSVTISSDNNTLAGVRDAINAANIGVRASIVNDGSGFRLVFDAADSGASNAFVVEVSEADGGLDQLSYSTSASSLERTRAGADASFSINGLRITRSSNDISDAVSGLSLSLSQEGGPVRIDVRQDLEKAKRAITDFANAYNALQVEINNVAGVDVASGQGGVLTGDATIRGISSTLRSLLGGTVGVLEGEAVRSLADIGISTRVDGTLELDTARLEKALRDDFALVGAVFAPVGRPSNAAVDYLGKAGTTQPGRYEVNITRAATRGQFSGSPLSSDPTAVPIQIGGGNDSLQIKVNGRSSGVIRLSHGSYADGAALAAELQARINGDDRLNAAQTRVTVEYDAAARRFVIYSDAYGSESTVEITRGNGALGLPAGAGTAGVDVIGTINGRAAEGKGDILTSTQGPSEGLKLRIRGSETGPRGAVTFSQGLMESLKSTIAGYLDSDGPLDTRTETLKSRLDDIELRRERLEDRLASLEARLVAQFTAMDTLVAQLQSTSSFLAQQLANLSKLNEG